jgi:hypothetical protein
LEIEKGIRSRVEEGLEFPGALLMRLGSQTTSRASTLRFLAEHRQNHH